MRKVHLTIAISEYEHVGDFLEGHVSAEGIDITRLKHVHEEIFFRFLKYREWDVSEVSFAKYVSLVSQEDKSLIAIPVFPSRIFRLSSFYVHSNGGIHKPEDLAGKKIGIPEWAQTASVYTRGYLSGRIGIPLQDIEWFQAGVNEPGRTEKVSLNLPEGVRYTQVKDRSLTDLLLSKDVDAVLSARPPQHFLNGNPEIVRLFENFQAEEVNYWQETGIFPIMHVVVIRAEVYQKYPWIAMNLFKAFQEAKENSISRMLDISSSRVPIPWGHVYAQRAVDMFGKDYWPYGIEANRNTLETFLKFAYDQGVCHRLLAPEELFAKEVQSLFKI